MQELVRFPAVAGTFYPSSRAELGALVTSLLSESRPKDARCPKALVVPHAGYVYSGSIAASGFARVATHGERIERVVLVGPAHRVRVAGLVSPGVSHMRTPLGDVVVDLEAIATVPDIEPNPTA